MKIRYFLLLALAAMLSACTQKGDSLIGIWRVRR